MAVQKSVKIRDKVSKRIHNKFIDILYATIKNNFHVLITEKHATNPLDYKIIS